MFAGAPPHPRCFLAGGGGLDITVISEELSLLRVLSSSRALDCIRTYMPRLKQLTVPSSPPTHPVHIEIQAAWDSLPASVSGAAGVRHPLTPPAPPPPPARNARTASPPSTDSEAAVTERRALSAAMAAHRREALFLSMGELDRTLLEASHGKHGRAWADVTPTYACYHMTSTQARLAYCIWLGGEVAELRGAADPRGRDRLRSDAAGRMLRHTAVCDSIGDMEKEAVCGVHFITSK